MNFIFKISRTQKGFIYIQITVDQLPKSVHFLLVKNAFSLDQYANLYVSEIVTLHGVPLRRFKESPWEREGSEVQLGGGIRASPKEEGSCGVGICTRLVVWTVRGRHSSITARRGHPTTKRNSTTIKGDRAHGKNGEGLVT